MTRELSGDCRLEAHYLHGLWSGQHRCPASFLLSILGKSPRLEGVVVGRRWEIQIHENHSISMVDPGRHSCHGG